MAPETQAITEAVVGKGQGPLAALEAAGLDKQQQIAAYGQLLASGQIQLNAQGGPSGRRWPSKPARRANKV